MCDQINIFHKKITTVILSQSSFAESIQTLGFRLTECKKEQQEGASHIEHLFVKIAAKYDYLGIATC